MDWSYIRNLFNNVTKGNHKRMLMMGRDHCDKLGQYAADPDIAALSLFVNPAFTDFENVYSEVNVNAAFYQGNTKMVEDLMQQLRGNKIKQWDIWIQNEFLDDTPQYLMLLPNRRTPFQNGAYELRIDAVRTLQTALQRFPNLANVSTDVQAFMQNLDSARTAQQQVESLDQSLRQRLESSRLELAKQMHRAFGFLLYKHYQNPTDIIRYYELKYLQSPASSTTSLTYSTYTLSPNTRLSLFDGQLSPNSYFNLRIKGQGTCRAFTSSDTQANLPVDALQLSAAQEETFYANELTDNNGFNWLILVNETSATVQVEVAKTEVTPD